VAEQPLPLFEPKDAVAFFRRKRMAIGFSWLDVFRSEHDKAFTVAKAMTRDLLEDIRGAMDAAIAEGQTLEMFRKALRPVLQAKGWWGRKVLTDPLTGEQVAAQLGSPNRLRVIYRTNMRTAYASGRWARTQRTKDAFPLLRYVAVLDGRERPEHHAWHNTLLPVDHPWWSTHYPPCDWGCRCRALALNDRMAAKKGLSITQAPRHFGTRQWVNKRSGEVFTIEKGIGAGWDYHPGKAALEGLTPDPLPPGFGSEAAARADSRWQTFDAAFGLNADNGWGKVFTDAGGWPVVVTRRMVRLESAGRLKIITQLLTAPQEIRWAWVKDRTGAAVLMRRYVKGDAMLDLGRLGWRLGMARDGGETVWRRAQLVAATYNPRQPRDNKGRWSGGLESFFKQVMAVANGKAGAKQPKHILGAVTSSVHMDLERLGISKRPKTVALDHDLTVHMVRRHGQDHRGQQAISLSDLRKLPAILAHADSMNHGNPRNAPNGSPRLFFSARFGKASYTGSVEVRKHDIVPISLRKR
jgi:SPP1 gp7 family putative phage head morphogenesis protein